MCYAKPGPRCSAHAKKILKDAEAVFKAAKTQGAQQDAYDALRKAQAEYDMTPEGQKALRTLIDAGRDTDGSLATRLQQGAINRKEALQTVKMLGLILSETEHRDLEARRTANVSDFETTFVNAVNDPSQVSALNDIPDSKRPKAFRGQDISPEVIENFRSTLKRHLGVEELDLTSSRNNLSGADFYEKNSGTHVEVKLGAATDVNFGMNRFEEVFGNGFASHLPSEQDRAEWKKTFLAGQQEKQLEDYRSSLRGAVERMNADVAAGKVTVNQDFLNKMALGKLNIPDNEKVVRVTLGADRSWEIAKVRELSGSWKIDKVEYTDKHRINVYVQNDTYAMRFTYNQKNTYRAGEFKTNPAAPTHGLGTPSFNGWVTPILNEK